MQGWLVGWRSVFPARSLRYAFFRPLLDFSSFPSIYVSIMKEILSSDIFPNA